MDNDIVQRLETATKLAAAAKRGLTQIPTMDAQALLLMLKEKEPAEPVPVDLDGWALHWECGACRFVIGTESKFCRNCGRPVKWSD